MKPLVSQLWPQFMADPDFAACFGQVIVEHARMLRQDRQVEFTLRSAAPLDQNLCARLLASLQPDYEGFELKIKNLFGYAMLDEHALRILLEDMKRDGVPINGFLDRSSITITGQNITVGVCHGTKFLQEMGFEVTYLPVDHLGHISLEDLEKAIREDTILVSVMYVNNEVGAVEPIEAISQCIKKKNPKTLFHVDAIQAYGKYKIRPKKQGIDLLSVSGHKIHAPKGVGFLYIRDGVKIRPILFGGGQQKGMRSGTENVPGCVGLGVAAREAYKDFDARIEKLYTLREHLIAGLKPLGGVTINGSEDRTNAPQIVSASFEGVRSEVLLHALEDKGVYVSSGSACSSNHPGISGTLKGIGVKKELLDSTIRFSLGDLNTEEEVDYAIGVLGELLPVLRRYQMK